MLIQSLPVVEEFGKHHDRKGFSCGDAALDEYIRKRASQDVRRRISRVFVAVGDKLDTIAGFYTLSTASIEAELLPDKLRSKLPKYPIPAVLIGRLAVDERYQSKGLGSFLLMDAFNRILMAGESIGIFAVLVEAKHDRATTFYEKYGFQSFRRTPRRMFLPLGTLIEFLKDTNV